MTSKSDNLAHIPGLAARTLACAVIKQALTDALDPTAPADVRADAQAFLAGDEWYKMWCEAGGYDARPLLHQRAA
jgi:hypothetical protein